MHDSARHVVVEPQPAAQLADRLSEDPPSPDMAAKLRVTAHKDWALMAILAGLVSYHDERAVPIGRQLEARARQGETSPTVDPITTTRNRSLIARIKAGFAA